ncbi:hypothetical protein FS749_002751 [Ceratobasidium sp. UAMH 11750]|nr:hypothetical protein FS749_002751 [Ceratobasidium sp. UAMH 11750]
MSDEVLDGGPNVPSHDVEVDLLQGPGGLRSGAQGTPAEIAPHGADEGGGVVPLAPPSLDSGDVPEVDRLVERFCVHPSSSELAAALGLELMPELGLLAEGLGNIEFSWETRHGRGARSLVVVEVMRFIVRPEMLL